jgi:hypothetical protein
MSNSEPNKRPSFMALKIRRTRKNLDRMRLRLEGHDNSQAILLERYNAIYFQIPKVASTAIKRKLKEEMNVPGRGVHNIRFPLADPHKLRNGDYSDYFRFGFVRNPWDRIVSCYKAKICRKANINGGPWLRFLYYTTPNAWHATLNKFLPTPILSSYMSFDEFVAAVVSISDQLIDKHLRSQHTFLCDDDGELLTSYIGRLESFSEDFNHVARRIGLPSEEPRNTSPKKKSDLGTYYNQHTWDLVADRYRRDIELLGYSNCCR